MSDPREQARELLKDRGTFVRRAKHGELWDLPGGRVLVPGTPSDRRAWANALADVRRKLRAEVEPPVADPAEAGTARVNLGPRGIHVQDLPVRVVRHEGAEATLDVAALAGLVLGDRWSEEHSTVECSLRDLEGEEVVGPLTLTVRVEIEEEPK